jgi:hypothetical protein
MTAEALIRHIAALARRLRSYEIPTERLAYTVTEEEWKTLHEYFKPDLPTGLETLYVHGMRVTRP